MTDADFPDPPKHAGGRPADAAKVKRDRHAARLREIQQAKDRTDLACRTAKKTRVPETRPRATDDLQINQAAVHRVVNRDLDWSEILRRPPRKHAETVESAKIPAIDDAEPAD